MHKLAIQRRLLTGVLLILPLWLTYLVIRFVFHTLAGVTAPAVRTAADLPEWALLLLSAGLTLLLLYLLGWLGSWVLGKRLIHSFDRLMERIPMVQSIYGGAKKLLNVLQSSPESAQRVVLVDFPHQGMKAVGLVTRVLTDQVTGHEYAAVYVPTTPNPTSGFLELVPVDRVHPSDMTLDEAMTFIMSGGAINPSRFTPKPAAPPADSPAGSDSSGGAAETVAQ
jgi:uncharacterized membrane protein